MEERLYLYGLSRVKGIGPRRLETLLSHYGSAREIWTCKTNLLQSDKVIGPRISAELLHLRETLDLEKEMESLARLGITVYTILDAGYPARLRNIATAPIVLYCRGSLPDHQQPAIAIVGARRCSPYGQKVAASLARELSETGVVVVSGLARGIDSAAHQGCLEAGGITMAVLGTGIDVVYPRENKKLMAAIAERGAVVSEYPPGTRPDKGNFPQRNRIISGLVEGVVVVEANETSGSLITADLALEQGRDVFAVPGMITCPQSKGTNNLIKQGAKLVDSVNDILEEYGIEIREPGSQPVGVNLNENERIVFQAIGEIPISLESIIAESKMTPAGVISTLTCLEIKGLIKRMPGQRYVSLL